MNSHKITGYILPAALFCIIFAVYVLTLCPTVYWDDAGELITVSRVLGISHPPGHPLYTILGHMFSLFPIGSIAWRVNLMSAFFGALASALVYPVALQLSNQSEGSRFAPSFAAASASLLAAFGMTLWDQAVVAETSTLHAFFFMMLVLVFLKMERVKNEPVFPRWLFFFSFLYGLSLTNHVAGVFVMPAFCLWAVLVLQKRLLSLKVILPSLVFFCLGLCVYLYLPLRSMQNPVVDWGNPETLKNFLWVVSAEQFKKNVFSLPQAPHIIHALLFRLSDIRRNFMAIGCVFLVVGTGVCFKRRRDFFLFAVAVVLVLEAVSLNPAFIPAYFIPALLVMAVVAALGAEAAVSALTGVFGSSKLRVAAVSIATLLLVPAPLLSFTRNYTINDRSDYYLARDYAGRILDALPPKSLLFTIDVNTMFTIWYLQFCEGKRTDVQVIEPTWIANSQSMRTETLRRCPNVKLPEPGEKVKRITLLEDTKLFDKDLVYSILEKNSKVRPVYWGAAPVFRSLRPQGLIYEFVAETEQVLREQDIVMNQEYWTKLSEEFFRNSSLRHDRLASSIYPETLRHQAFYYSRSGRNDLAEWAYKHVIRLNPFYARAWLGLGDLYIKERKPDDAIMCFEQAGNLDYQVKPTACFKMGTVYFNIGQYEKAAEKFTEVIKNDDRYRGVHNFLGAIFLKNNLVEKAEEEFQKEILLNPSTPGTYSNLAQILIQKQQFDQAEEVLRNGVEVQPMLWQNYYLLARIEAMRGNKNKAEELLQLAIKNGGSIAREMAKEDPAMGKMLEVHSLGI